MLPNAERGDVPKTKIIRYLLDLSHPDGSSKARFFIAHGYAVEAWEILAAALKEHAQTFPVVRIEPSPFGKRYVVEGPLNTPDGRNPQVRAIWFLEDNSDTPRLVTAYPLRTERGSPDD
jgi:hypothetical protein